MRLSRRPGTTPPDRALEATQPLGREAKQMIAAKVDILERQGRPGGVAAKDADPS